MPSGTCCVPVYPFAPHIHTLSGDFRTRPALSGKFWTHSAHSALAGDFWMRPALSGAIRTLQTFSGAISP